MICVFFEKVQRFLTFFSNEKQFFRQCLKQSRKKSFKLHIGQCITYCAKAKYNEATQIFFLVCQSVCCKLTIQHSGIILDFIQDCGFRLCIHSSVSQSISKCFSTNSMLQICSLLLFETKKIILNAIKQTLYRREHFFVSGVYFNYQCKHLVFQDFWL